MPDISGPLTPRYGPPGRQLRRGHRLPLSSPTARARLTLCRSVTGAEEVEHDSDHDQHEEGADPADCGGIAAELHAAAERRIVHVDRPGVGRTRLIEATHDHVFLDDRHCATEANHRQDENDRQQPPEGYSPEHAPLARAVNAGG